MTTKNTRVTFDRESLMKIKEFVVNSPEIFVPIKIEYNRRISVESVDEMANRTKPFRRRFTSYNSDDTGNSEDIGEWIDAGSKPNHNNTGFNRGNRGSGFRGPHRGGFIQRQKSWRSNFDLEPVADTGEDSSSGHLVKRNFTPPGLDSIKWFYIDLEDITRGPFSSQQMLEWFKGGFLSVSLLIRRSCDLYFKTIAIFFSACKGSNPFEVNTLLYLPPILVAEGGTAENMNSNNFWHYLPDCGSLQGPFSGAQMQVWLNKKLIYPTLKVRRIDQTQFFDLGELIKIVPDAFTNSNISLEDLNSLLDVSIFRQTTVNFSRQVSLTDTMKSDQDSTGNICIGLMSPDRGNKFWYFKDGPSIIGPITPQEMKSWFDNHYLPGDLLCRKGDTGDFFPLEKICNTLSNPFSDVYLSNDEVRNCDSVCSLCNNVNCLFRGSSIHLPSTLEVATNGEVKDPCVRLKNFTCDHGNAVEKVITLNDIERMHEITIPGNPQLRITRTFVRMRHCDKDDYEYSIISNLNNNPPIENSPHSKIIQVKTTQVNEPKLNRPHTKPVHVDLNDSLFNNIQFVFGSQKADSSLLEEDEKEVVENVPPPVAPKRPAPNNKPNGATVWSGDVSSIVGANNKGQCVVNNNNIGESIKESVQSDASSSIKANASGDGGSKTSKKKKSKSVKSESNTETKNDGVKKASNESNKNKQATTKKEIQAISKPQNVNKQPIEIPQQQENEMKGTEDNKKKKKPNKQQAWEEECQKRQEEQNQKILQQLIIEQEEEQERRRLELEKQQLQLKALKAKKNLIINDMKELEKMENQLNQITLPKQAAWASTKSAVNNNQKVSSFADIQSQQAKEMANKRLEQASKGEPITAPVKQTSWVNVATVKGGDKVLNQNSPIVKKAEIKFNDPKVTEQKAKAVKTNQSTPSSKVVEAMNTPKVVTSTNNTKKAKTESPISIWNISDAGGAIKKNLKDKSQQNKVADKGVLPAIPNETIKSPESKNIKNQRQDLIVWCSKQMINLKDYTKIQSIDSETMANLLCDLDNRDDVSKFVEDCFGKSKMIDKFVKDFSQKKNRLLNSR